MVKERREMSEEFLVSGAYDSYKRKGKQIQGLDKAIDILVEENEV